MRTLRTAGLGRCHPLSVDSAGGQQPASQHVQQDSCRVLLPSRVCCAAVPQADSQAVDDLSIGLASTNNTVAGLADSLQDLLQQLAAAQKGLASLQDSLNSHAPNAGMHAGLGQHTAHDTGSPSTARGAQEEQPQLTVLAGKVAVLEAALPGLQAAVAAGAQPRRVSGEQPASSKLVQALAAQLSDLAGQVASLAAQNSSNGGAGSSASAQPCGPSLEDASALSDAEPAAGAGSYPDTAGFGAAGAVLSAELRAEFDGRLSGLEGLVQEVAAMKADATALQELRALLADTATQVSMQLVLLAVLACRLLASRCCCTLSPQVLCDTCGMFTWHAHPVNGCADLQLEDTQPHTCHTVLGSQPLLLHSLLCRPAACLPCRQTLTRFATSLSPSNPSWTASLASSAA